MQLSPNLKRQIVDFLFSLPNIHSIESQRALLYDAGLDRELQDLIPFGKPTAEFIPILVDILLRYGKANDEQNAIVVLLEATKRYIGSDKRAFCNDLIEQAKVAAPDKEQREGTPIISPVLHNLPQPDYIEFIGRENELEQIYKLLSPQHRSWVITIDGIGGIGKSALALETADNYRRKYYELSKQERFDAIIWTTAKQTVLTGEGIIIRSQALRTLNDIYMTIAITLQREDITHAPIHEYQTLIRQALTQRRTLLIIDNLETVDDEQVLTFIREVPAPTKVIVTTRHRIDIAYPIRLVAMPEEDALQLITDTTRLKNITLSADESRQIYYRTGGVPLAISWSVARIAFGYSVEAVLTQLGQPTSDIAKFCFDMAVESIKGKMVHTVLLALSFFATDASREALGQIANLPPLDRDESLVILEKLSLINKVNNRFSLLPLTKSFLVAYLEKNPDIKESLKVSFIQYFQEVSQKFGGEQAELYPNLDADIKNIQLAIEWAYQSKMWGEVGSYADSLGHFLDRRGLWRELIEYAEMAIESGLRTNNKHLIMRHRIFELGWLKALRFKNFEEGLASLQEGKQLAIELNDKRQYAIAVHNEGDISRNLGDYDKAISLLQESLNTLREIGDKRWEIRTLGSLGGIERDRKIGIEHLNII